MSVGILSGTKILVGEGDLKSFLREKGFGEERGGRQELSLIEVLYLVENDKMLYFDFLPEPYKKNYMKFCA